MKKFIVAVALAALTLVACNKEEKVKEFVDDVTLSTTDGLSFSVNAEGEFYVAVASKDKFDSACTDMNGGNEGLTAIQICDGFMAGDNVQTVTGPVTVAYGSKSVTWFMGMSAGETFVAGNTYYIIVIPVEVAKNNNKDEYDQIKIVEVTL